MELKEGDSKVYDTIFLAFLLAHHQTNDFMFDRRFFKDMVKNQNNNLKNVKKGAQNVEKFYRC